MNIKKIKQSTSNGWFEVALKEGKNREIRKLIAYCGGQVNRLIRTHFGPFTLRDLPTGECQLVPRESIAKYFDLSQFTYDSN